MAPPAHHRRLALVALPAAAGCLEPAGCMLMTELVDGRTQRMSSVLQQVHNDRRYLVPQNGSCFDAQRCRKCYDALQAALLYAPDAYLCADIAPRCHRDELAPPAAHSDCSQTGLSSMHEHCKAWMHGLRPSRGTSTARGGAKRTNQTDLVLLGTCRAITYPAAAPPPHHVSRRAPISASVARTQLL